MTNEILNSLLKEYDRKKIQAEIDLDIRKKELYEKIPELQKIENDLSTYAIETTKNILLYKNNSVNDLKEKIYLLNTKKNEIFKKYNIDKNYLTPNYNCSICQDTGYVITNNYQKQMCNCLKQKLIDYSFNNSNMTNLNTENFSTFNENIFSDDVDIQKYKFNISPRENIKNIKKKCENFIDTFDKKETKNLLFTGNTGLR